MAREHSRAELLEISRAEIGGAGLAKSSTGKPNQARAKRIDFESTQLPTIESAIRQAKARFSTESDADALEQICRDFLSRPSLEKLLDDLPKDDLARAFGRALAKFNNITTSDLFAKTAKARQDFLARSPRRPFK